MVSKSIALETTIKLGMWKETMNMHRENLSRPPLCTDLSQGSMYTDIIPKDKRSTLNEQKNDREGRVYSAYYLLQGIFLRLRGSCGLVKKRLVKGQLSYVMLT